MDVYELPDKNFLDLCNNISFVFRDEQKRIHDLLQKIILGKNFGIQLGVDSYVIQVFEEQIDFFNEIISEFQTLEKWFRIEDKKEDPIQLSIEQNMIDSPTKKDFDDLCDRLHHELRQFIDAQMKVVRNMSQDMDKSKSDHKIENPTAKDFKYISCSKRSKIFKNFSDKFTPIILGLSWFSSFLDPYDRENKWKTMKMMSKVK